MEKVKSDPQPVGLVAEFENLCRAWDRLEVAMEDFERESRKVGEMIKLIQDISASVGRKARKIRAH